MKYNYRILFFVIYLFFVSSCFAQLKMGLNVGVKSTFAEYLNLRIDPPRLYTIIRPKIALNISYISKRQLYIQTGINFNQGGTIFQLKGAPLMRFNEEFPKIIQPIHYFQKPLKFGFNFRYEKRRIIPYGGIAYNTIWYTFEPVFSGSQTEVFDGESFRKDYTVYRRSVNYHSIMLLVGVKADVKLSAKLDLVFNLEYQLGTRPILFSFIQFDYVKEANNFTIEDIEAFSIYKGDGVLFSLGLSYTLSKT